ncbi:MAG: isochorismatase family protein [Candidatus Zixiibacteriota bacterium]
MAEKHSYDPVAEAPGLLEEIAPYNARRPTLDVPASALLIIDMQNAFLHPDGAIYLPAGAAIVDEVAKVAHAFREAGRPVFYTRHAEDPAGGNAGMMARWWENSSPQEGTFDAAVFEGLAPRPGDVVVPKVRYSAFVATDLELRLREARVADLVITGVMANLCCETTARDAFMRDFRVFFAADGTAAPSLAFHRSTLLNLSYGFAHVVTCDDIIKMVRGGK